VLQAGDVSNTNVNALITGIRRGKKGQKKGDRKGGRGREKKKGGKDRSLLILCFNSPPTARTQDRRKKRGKRKGSGPYFYILLYNPARKYSDHENLKGRKKKGKRGRGRGKSPLPNLFTSNSDTIEARHR